MTRTIIPKNDEYVETPCFRCETHSLKVKRVVVQSVVKSTFARNRLYVYFECKCGACGNKQTIDLVEMP